MRKKSITKNMSWDQFTQYCRDEFDRIDKKMAEYDKEFGIIGRQHGFYTKRLEESENKIATLREVAAEVFEKIDHLTGNLVSTRRSVIDLQYRINDLESK